MKYFTHLFRVVLTPKKRVIWQWNYNFFSFQNIMIFNLYGDSLENRMETAEQSEETTDENLKYRKNQTKFTKKKIIILATSKMTRAFLFYSKVIFNMQGLW